MKLKITILVEDADTGDELAQDVTMGYSDDIPNLFRHAEDCVGQLERYLPKKLEEKNNG